MRNIVPAQQLLSSEINILLWVCLKWNFLRISHLWPIRKISVRNITLKFHKEHKIGNREYFFFKKPLLLMEEKLKLYY